MFNWIFFSLSAVVFSVTVTFIVNNHDTKYKQNQTICETPVETNAIQIEHFSTEGTI